MGKSWDDVKFSGENRVRLNELISIVDYTKNVKFRQYRFVGDLTPYAQQWLPIYKDGKPLISQKGKPVRIPFNVTNFDPETGEYDENKPCPFVAAAQKMLEYITDDDEKKQLRPSTGFFGQAISRKLQDNPDKDGKPSKTERSTGFKDSLESDSYTPIECHQLNYTVGQGLESAKELNKHKDKKTGERVEKSIADPKYGCDIQIKYDAKAQGQGKYKVNKADASRLTEEEQGYLLWDIVSALKETTLSRKEAKIEADRILAEFMKAYKKKKKSDDSPDVDDVPEDIEEELSGKSKKKKKKAESPDDDSPSPNLDSPDEDDSPSPVKSSSKKKKKKAESPDESPDADDSPSPVKNKKKKKAESPDEDDSPSPVKSSGKKKPKVKEEDDDSPVKSSSKKKKKKAESPDEEDDDDEEEIDLDAMEDDD